MGRSLVRLRSELLRRTVGAHTAGFPHRPLGAETAKTSGFKIGPGLLRAVPANRTDVEPVTLRESLRDARFNLRGKTGHNAEGGGNAGSRRGVSQRILP